MGSQKQQTTPERRLIKSPVVNENYCKSNFLPTLQGGVATGGVGVGVQVGGGVGVQVGVGVQLVL